MLVNGKTLNKEGFNTVSELLGFLKINENRVVVELNKEIINVKDFPEIILNEEDKIEIIAFVGGG